MARLDRCANRVEGPEHPAAGDIHDASLEQHAVAGEIVAPPDHYPGAVLSGQGQRVRRPAWNRPAPARTPPPARSGRRAASPSHPGSSSRRPWRRGHRGPGARCDSRRGQRPRARARAPETARARAFRPALRAPPPSPGPALRVQPTRGASAVPARQPEAARRRSGPSPSRGRERPRFGRRLRPGFV